MKKIMNKHRYGSQAFILIFYSFYVCSCNEESNRQVKASDVSKIISEEYSPNGKYKFILRESSDSINPSTQVFIDFGNCGSSVYNPEGWNLGIKVNWKTNDTIVVKCKNNIDKMRLPFAGCIQDKVNIQYVYE
jgi:hypothetical protein